MIILLLTAPFTFMSFLLLLSCTCPALLPHHTHVCLFSFLIQHLPLRSHSFELSPFFLVTRIFLVIFFSFASTALSFLIPIFFPLTYYLFVHIPLSFCVSLFTHFFYPRVFFCLIYYLPFRFRSFKILPFFLISHIFFAVIFFFSLLLPRLTCSLSLPSHLLF